MEFRKQKPIYLQIADRLMEQILSGDPAAEERMPSVRDVAASMGVNPNTVMRTSTTCKAKRLSTTGAAWATMWHPTPKRKFSTNNDENF